MRLRLAAGLIATSSVAAAKAQPVTVVGVSIVESRRSVPLVANVTVDRGRFIRVDSTGGAEVRGQRVDGRGKYLIPGLWDLHVHTAVFPILGTGAVAANADYFFPLFVRFGVVGVRDMSGRIELLTQWRADVTAGRRLGPLLVVTGGKVGQWERPVAPGAAPVVSDRDLPQAVDALVDAGVDFIKVDGMAEARLAKVTALAAARGRVVVGHVAPGVPLATAARLGLKSVEHLHGAVVGCSSAEDQVVEAARREQGWFGRLLTRVGWWDPLDRYERRMTLALDSADPRRCDALAATLVKHRTWLVPTLVGLAAVASPVPLVDSARRHLVPTVLATRHQGPRDTSLARRIQGRERAVFKALLAAGVPMLAGTDAPGTGRIPGASLLDELELMVAAGATPRQALWAATEGAGLFLEHPGVSGTIAVGHRADAVLLDANPLESIGAVRRIAGVMVAGRWLGLDELRRLETNAAALVAEAQRAATKP